MRHHDSDYAFDSARDEAVCQAAQEQANAAQWTFEFDAHIRSFRHSCGVRMLFAWRATDDGINRAKAAHACLTPTEIYFCGVCQAKVEAGEVIEGVGQSLSHETCCGYVARAF